jgi:alpha-tubulin suppressor-like RCC1 family protein
MQVGCGPSWLVVAVLVSAACSAATTAMPSTGLPPATSAPAGPLRAIDLAWGRSTCAVRSDGRVVCWGSDGGALGDGSREARSAPGLVPGLDGIIEIRGFPFEGVCALRFDRSLWCWGFGDEFGSARLAPTRVLDDVADYVFTEAHDVTTIYAGDAPEVCARRPNGNLVCVQFPVERAKSTCVFWGDDSRQHCLQHTFPVRAVPAPPPADARLPFGEPDDQRPAMPEQRACALFGREVRCRGSNDQGQLGNPALKESAEFVPVEGLNDVVSLASFLHSTCAVRAGGQVFCWGRNHGELKIPPDPEHCVAAGSGGIKVPCTRRPTAIPVTDAIQVVDGGWLSFLTRAGDVWLGCPLWTEKNTACQSDRFYRAEGLPPLARIQWGRRGALCGLDRAGAVYCYGYGSSLGDGAPLIDRAPVQIPGLTGVRAVRVQLSGGACAVLADGSVRCWDVDDAPRGLTNITALGDGCALARDGRVWCWGRNGDGEMGLGRRSRPDVQRPDGTYDPAVSATPLPVPRVGGITSLVTDEARRCTLDGAGILRCWGLFLPAKLHTWSATTFPGVPPLQGVHLPGNDVLGLARDGSIWRVTRDFGALSGRKEGVVATRTELGPALALSTHGTDSDAQTSSSKPILCWIAPDRSARCTGTPGPIQIAGPVAQLSVSKQRGCALLEDGHLSCWGRAPCAENDKTVCRGEVWNRVEPILDQVTQVSVGDAYTCAVRVGGTVWCWGRPAAASLPAGRLQPPRVSHVNIDAR